MTASPKDEFARVLAAAKRNTPGGVFNGEDRRGLMRRAVALGVPSSQARAMLAEMAKRPRHPVTRGIE